MAGQAAADGTPFGRYRLVELLGRGGMGEVWRAHDTVTDRVVAIKLLPANLSEDDDFQQRFRREAHAAARLDTPHVVPIYDYGEIDGRLFVSMRLIAGRDLDAVLTDGPLEPARAVRIIDQAAKALHAAHKVGLLHRDIKPSNILLDDDDFAYLIDFGIARAADETRMTKSGSVIGTFQYIAPERLDTKIEEDARADIYSLACVLYEALTGQPPFAGTTTAHLMYAHVNTPPPRPSTTQPDVPAGFDAVIAKGMAKGPDQRYATTIELADAARDAITTPIPRPVPAPTRPGTDVVPEAVDHTRPQPPLSPWAAQLPPESLSYQAPQFASPAPQYQRRISATPLSTAPPTPTRSGRVSQRTTIALVAGVIGLVVVILAGVGITSYLLRQPSTNSLPSTLTTSTTAAPTTTTPTGPPPLAENALEALLLNPDQINTAMGTTGMMIARTMVGLYSNNTSVADKACLPVSSVAEKTGYAGWTGAHGQKVTNPGEPLTHVVDQFAVSFKSALAASTFFSRSAKSWPACRGQYTEEPSGGPQAVWSVGPVSNTDGTLSVTKSQVSPQPIVVGWSCQHALTVANNVAIDVEACSASPSDAGITIAHQIAVKVPT